MPKGGHLLEHRFDPRLCAEHLSAIVRCNTVSHEDESLMDFASWEE